MLNIILTVLIVILIWLWKWNRDACNYWKDRNVPYYPAPLLLSPATISSIMLSLPYLRKVYDSHPDAPIVGYFRLRTPILMLKDLSLIQRIMTTDFKYFPDKRLESAIDEKTAPLSMHLLALGGNKWKVLRTRMTPVFTSGKIKNAFGLINESVDNFLSSINNNTVVIQKESELLISDIIGTFAFGVSYKSSGGESQLIRETALKLAPTGFWTFLKHQIRQAFPKFFKALPLRGHDQHATTFFLNYFKRMLQYRRENRIDRPDFIQILMKLDEEDELKLKGHSEQEQVLKFTDNLIAAQGFSFYMAGFETTAHTMAAILYELAQHPEVVDKIKKEVDEILEAHGSFSYESLQPMEYLQQVIDETSRLHSAVYQAPRICIETYLFPNTDLLIEPGFELTIPLFSIHNDPKYFSNPQVFDPERFSKENRQLITEGSFIPFGGGQRMCIGMRFTIIELKLAIAKTVYKYTLELDSRTKVPIGYYPYSPQNKFDGPIYIKFIPRN